MILDVGKSLVVWYRVSDRGWWSSTGCHKEVGGTVVLGVGQRLVVLYEVSERG